MHFLDILFPKRCVGCGRVGRYFCDRCHVAIQIIQTSETICPVCEKPAADGMTHVRCRGRWTIDGLTSFFHYRGAVQKAVKAVKYRYVSDLCEAFIGVVPLTSYILLQQLTKLHHPIFIPIPLHPSRLRNRGFNQAEILGSLVADRLGIPMVDNLLYRVKKTTPQVEVKERKKRLKNMEGVFEVNKATIQQYNNPPASEAGIAIFLFDDVFTTGATMRAAAAVLKRAGAPFVWGTTMAR